MQLSITGEELDVSLDFTPRDLLSQERIYSKQRENVFAATHLPSQSTTLLQGYVQCLHPYDWWLFLSRARRTTS